GQVRDKQELQEISQGQIPEGKAPSPQPEA
ncbi:unnamed protein product, partial [marine sediment metagenome]